MYVRCIISFDRYSKYLTYHEIESDVDRVELCRLTLSFFRRRFNGVVIYFFSIPTSKLFHDASEFSVTSLYVVFFSSNFMSVSILVVTSRTCCCCYSYYVFYPS